MTTELRHNELRVLLHFTRQSASRSRRIKVAGRGTDDKYTQNFSR